MISLRHMRVSTSIKLGFAFITAMLIGTGLYSAYQLGNIGALTTKVNTLSIPALVHSSQLQVQFVKMGENALIDFYTPQLSALDGVEQEFQNINDSFNKDAKLLNAVVSNDPDLHAALKSVLKTNEVFVGNVKTLFNTHRQQLTLDEAIKAQQETLEENIDDAGSLALDLTDASGIKPLATQAAEALETDLGALLDLVIDLASSSTLVDVNTVATEIQSASAALQQKAAVITEQSSGDAAEYAAELSDKITTIIDLSSGNGSITDNKLGSLNAYEQAKSALQTSKQNIDAGVTQLNQLFVQATNVANDSQTQVSNQVDSVQNFTIVLIVIASISALVIAIRTVRSIINPLREVNGLLNVAASGDLTQRLDDSIKDEFGELAKNCNSLIDNLRDLIQGIISRSTQLAAASEETSAITTETTQAIQAQRSQMEQAATATTEMSSTSQSVLNSADDALNEIKQADSESQRVKSISEQNKHTITQLATEVEDASKVINKLHNDSASIGGILDVIRGIADQTNLLALNAAIEAARAGEQGRGFAVVADEVRSLASKTQESTQEIQAMIQVLQSGAEEAVDVMERGKKQADDCVAQTEIADAALNSITNAVHQTHDANEQISLAAQEQNQVSQQISESLESIVSIAEQTSLGADQTAISSHEVARLSEELRVSVDSFKV